MISLKNEIIDSGDVLAFKKVYKNIPSKSKRVEILFNDPNYTIKVYFPTLQFYKISRTNNFITIEGLCTQFDRGDYKLVEFSEQIELPKGIYGPEFKSERVGDYLIIKFKKE